MTGKYWGLALLACLASGPALASGTCKLSLRLSTTGLINQSLEKITVVAASSTSPEKPCPLEGGDEIVQINDRVVAGADAREFMAYWKGLPQNVARTYKVRRAGNVVAVVVK